MFGPLLKNRVLELNASDERGIAVIRDKVKTFAQSAVSTVEGRPSFKLIILDEADAMTGDAQSALRRVMEKYTRVTRFCLICNYISRIIEPLASRCAKFRFRPLPKEPMINRLKYICETENVQCENDAFEAILESSKGDMRRAITLLQSSANFNAQHVDRTSVFEVAGILPDEALDQVWDSIKRGLYDGIAQAVQNVLASGYSTTMMKSQFCKLIMNETDLDDVSRAEMLLKLAQADKLLVDGADEELQMLDICACLSKTWQKREKSDL